MKFANVIHPIEMALIRRQSILDQFHREGTDSYRLFCGKREGVAGLIVDRFNSFLVFSIYENQCALTDAEQKILANWYLDHLRDVQAVYQKKFIVDRSKTRADEKSYSPEPLAGSPCVETIMVSEYGVKFLVKPFQGFSVGIFLDQRDNRRFLGGLLKGGEVLNCFSYTGGFSVCSGLSGCRTTSVDLSKKFLNWARDNFRINGISDEEHLFVAADIFDFFRWANGQGKKYDLIILDPPSFSRNHKGKVFSVEKDLTQLMELCLPLVSENGYVFVSSNYEKWEEKEFKAKIKLAFAANQLNHFLVLPDLSKDFEMGTSPLKGCLIQMNKPKTNKRIT